MTKPADDQLKGRYVTFLLRDIHHPQPISILHELHDEDKLRGIVLDLSDGPRAEGSAFVIVKVPRVRELCIVSVDSIERIERPKRRGGVDE
ncbi:MAG: hypothetical protein ABJC89_17175 [Acidobacteriota bacterium]